MRLYKKLHQIHRDSLLCRHTSEPETHTLTSQDTGPRDSHSWSELVWKQLSTKHGAGGTVQGYLQLWVIFHSSTRLCIWKVEYNTYIEQMLESNEQLVID